ncbi:MAG: hypothetical protein KDC66_06440 [Phaeodactylibacter sp.]|nr:hypothetical protein [Phaeodactylibacter sp.]MCB9277171.1 hypothetical protein [Lewinellaceae bacterium]
MYVKNIFPFFCCIFLLAMPALHAQSTSFVFKPEADDDATPLPPENSTYKAAYEVYRNLVHARGDNRFPAPRFEMTGRSKKVAEILYNEPLILLEEKAYGICRSFGPDSTNALAQLLAHELTHYYEKHGWNLDFSSSFAASKPIKDSLKVALSLLNETQADYLGGFLAYSAGYDVFEGNSAFLDKVYKTYPLDTLDESTHPNLAKRRAMTKASAEKLAELIEIFETANYLAAIGKYADARAFYKNILKTYQSREIYNNLGVITIFEALTYFNESEVKYRLPLQLDLEPRSSKGSGFADTRNGLLEEAIRYFDSAISLDEDYVPAYLNKACAYTLLEDYERANFYATREAAQRAQNNPAFAKAATDALVLQGIIAARQEDKAKAEAFFGLAIGQGSNLAKYNKKVLLGIDQGETESPFSMSAPEKVDDFDLPLFSRSPFGKQAYTEKVEDKLMFFEFTAPAPKNSKVLISQYNNGERNAFFHITGKGYQGKSGRNIKIGDSLKAVTDAYKEPLRTIELSNGQLLVYNQVIFRIGMGDKVKSWAVYYSSSR